MILCNSGLGAATDTCYTILERGQIAHKDPTIKNLKFPSQGSGMSFMFPKGHKCTLGT